MKMTSLNVAEPGLSIKSKFATVHISISAGKNWREWAGMAFSDIRQSCALWRLVWTLGMFDIRLRYRGSVLGPFWLTLSTAVMVGSLGFLYSRLFHTDIISYLPFLSLSLVLWNFISTLTTEGCTCFTIAEPMIRAMRMPLSVHAGRVVVRNILVLGHNIVVIAAVFAILGKAPGAFSFLIVPACALWLVDAFAICLLLGVLCARYRDVPPIIASVMQIAFFVSPIMWNAAILAQRGIGVVLVKWNPFYDLLEIIRGPLMGTPTNLQTWAAAAGYSALLVVLAMIGFARARPRLAYWV
jgi:lipopolysaccharide transport system permease protein